VYTIHPAAGTLGLLLICTISLENKQKSFPIVAHKDPEDLVLWVSRYHGEEAEFVEEAETHFEEIRRDVKRWLPESQLRLIFD